MPPIEKVTCPHCGKMTLDGKFCMFCKGEFPEKRVCPYCQRLTFSNRFCTYCTKDMLEITTETIDPENLRAAMVLSSLDAHRSHKKLILARFEYFKQLPDGTFPGIKQVTVKRGTLKYMINATGEHELLDEGVHDVSRIGLGGGLSSSFQSSRSPSEIYFFTVLRKPIITHVVLPDVCTLMQNSNADEAETLLMNLFKGDEDSTRTLIGCVSRALGSISIRTSDDMFGGAALQLQFRIKNPVRLVNMLAESSGIKPRKDAPTGLVSMLKYPFDLVRQVFFGSTPPKEPSQSMRLQMIKLLPMIRFELAAAIAESIRNETVKDLYDSVDHRERVSTDLAKIMSTSFETYGIELERVTNFRFICPEYEELLKKKGATALDAHDIDDMRNRNKNTQVRRGLAQEDAKDIITKERELGEHDAEEKARLARKEIEESSGVAEMRDQSQLEMEYRDRVRLGAKMDFMRKQEIEDESTKAEKLRIKMETMLKLRNDYLNDDAARQRQEQDDVFRRQLIMMERTKGMSPEKVLAVALTQNPALQAAYVASMQSRDQSTFRDELAKAYSQNSNEFTHILKSAIEQFGKYHATRIGAQRVDHKIIELREDSQGETDPEGSSDGSESTKEPPN
jgi:hypothetical protein